MRYLILVFMIIMFLIVSLNNGFSANYMSKGDIVKKASGQSGVNIYINKGICEAKENEKCFAIDDKLPHKGYTVKEIEVDDYSKPIWEEKSNVVKCDSDIDCQEKLMNLLCNEGYQKFINKSFTEVYCTIILGYEKKIEEQLVEDQNLKDAYNARQQEKQEKENKKNSNKVALKTCLNSLKGNPSNSDLKACLILVVKHLFSSELGLDDL